MLLPTGSGKLPSYNRTVLIAVFLAHGFNLAENRKELDKAETQGKIDRLTSQVDELDAKLKASDKPAEATSSKQLAIWSGRTRFWKKSFARIPKMRWFTRNWPRFIFRRGGLTRPAGLQKRRSVWLVRRGKVNYLKGTGNCSSFIERERRFTRDDEKIFGFLF